MSYDSHEQYEAARKGHEEFRSPTDAPMPPSPFPLKPQEVREWMKGVDDKLHNNSVLLFMVLIFLALNSLAYWLNR